MKTLKQFAPSFAAAGGAVLLLTGLADTACAAEPEADPAARAEAEIAAAFGKVPDFIARMPRAALPGAWAEERDLEMSDATALTPREKALISLAVAAQIPCQYCIWLDTRSAKAAGASDEEIAEAVTMSALTRHWSTIFNGLQVDFDQFKADFGGEAAVAASH